jgi:NADPH:quinone reductase-like Zn-dependent oxidoreductase
MASGDRVLVTGIGGGAALAALQFAVASGNETWVTSSSDDKIGRAAELGAKGGFRYDADGWAAAAAKAAGPFDVIIDSAGGAGFGSLVDLAAPGGRIAFFGATRGNAPEIALRKVFWKQLSILGTTMGSAADWKAMTDFLGRHAIRPVISDTFPFERGSEAFDLMERGGQFGKIVVRH